MCSKSERESLPSAEGALHDSTCSSWLINHYAERTKGRRRAFFWYKKRPAASYSRMGGSHTTLGDEALDFRVRYGNGYYSFSMATGPKIIRFRK